ncbi:MAG: hypothetical protein JNM39_17605 [Bdellovibrionaceae bacterium]|nr:hypothetical protein [Pseudobdellovibrionaceae bacterium]
MRQPELPVKTRKVWVLGLVSILVITTIKSANVAAVENAVAKPKYPQCTLENVEKLRERHECLTSVGMKGCFQALGGAVAIVGGLLVAKGALLPQNKKNQQTLDEVLQEYKKLAKAHLFATREEVRLRGELVRLNKNERISVSEEKRGANQDQLMNAEEAYRKAVSEKLVARTNLESFGAVHPFQRDVIISAILPAYAGANTRLEILQGKPKKKTKMYETQQEVDKLRVALEGAYDDYLRGNSMRQRRVKVLKMGGGAASILGGGFAVYQGLGPEPEPIPHYCKKDHAEDLRGISDWARLDSNCKPEMTQAGLIDLNLRTDHELADLCVKNPALASTLLEFQVRSDQILKNILPKISDIDCQSRPVTFTTTLDGNPYKNSMAFDGGLWTLGGSFKSGGSLSNPLEIYAIKLDNKLQGGVFKSANPQFDIHDSGMKTVSYFLGQYVERGYPKTHIGADANLNTTTDPHLLGDSIGRQFLSAKISFPFVQKVCSEVLKEAASSSSAGGGTPTSPTAK